jgi:hypothetical protein
MAKAAKKAKAKKHKPDWPLVFADEIGDLKNRVAFIERQLAGVNAIPQPPAEQKAEEVT